MWNNLIRWSLGNRVAVLFCAAAVLIAGGYAASRMSVDVLPDITAPTVTVMTEVHGMAPDEVETLVTLPLETALNGVAGLRRLRSSSAIGLSIVWVEFDWDVDPYRARQVVAERLQAARASLPATAGAPILAPMSSIMGEIMFLGLVGAKGVDPMEVRDIAEWQVRRRLLSIAGVAQVMPIGGKLKQIQVVLDPAAMRRLGIGHRQILDALRSASENAPGGFYVSGHQEYLIRGVARAQTLQELGLVAVARRGSEPVLLRQVANIRAGAALARGTASIDGRPAVVLAVVKAPAANTLELTGRIDAALDSLAATLPDGVTLYRKGFRQSRFIEVAISNVSRHIVESAVLVAILLALFLMSWRTTSISLVALPLSLITGLLVLYAIGDSINTMTLGGFAIAIGALVVSGRRCPRRSAPLCSEPCGRPRWRSAPPSSTPPSSSSSSSCRYSSSAGWRAV
jgi:Cu/Ag efflux pump CusA